MTWIHSQSRNATYIAIILASAALVSAKTTTEADGKTMKPAKPLVYLTDGSVDFVALLPPPPTPDSLEQKSELDEIRAWQRLRTPEQIARGQEESKLDPMKAFAPVFGAGFTADKLPQVAKLLDVAGRDSKHFSSAAKDHWPRSRPPYVDPSLKPGAVLEDEPSYPSGHATRGMLFAILLSTMVPEKAADITARGEEIGFDRVIAAVHYHSDIVAGRALGQAVANALLASPKFQADLAAAKQELRSTLRVASK